MLGIVCQICGKRPATSHLSELGPDGQERKDLHLCATCIQDLSLDLSANPPSIASILQRKKQGGEATPTDGPADAVEDQPDPACPGCGLLLSEFSARNRFGCAQCYEAFRDQVEPLLVRYHGTAAHLGRVPSQAQSEAAAVRLARRAHLDSQLKAALKAEDYERAAELRDELRTLDDA